MFDENFYTLIIPAYNEAEVIGDVLKELGRPAGCQEIIVVDDGSKDDTVKIAREHRVSVISHRQNRGYGAALKTGIKAAKTDIAIIYDSDGQHRPEDLQRIAELSRQHDMVVGARSKGSKKDWFRAPGKLLIGFVANVLSGHKIPDFNSGLRSYNIPVIKKYLHLMPNGFSMSTTSTITLLKMGYSVKYIPIVTRVREGGKSYVRVTDGIRILMLILNLIILFSPQRVFLPISALFILGGIGYFILYSIFVEMDITSSMFLLIMTGLIMFFMGVICEQISAIRRELHK